MDIQRAQFDSHRFVKRLTKAGLSEEVAEILADEHTNLIVPDDVATKADVATVSENLDTVRAEMATKAEVATKADAATIEAKLDTIRAEVATKADAATVEAKLDTIRAEMVTKADLRGEIAACEARMEQRLQNAILEAKVSLIKWMITTMMVFSGIVIGAVTALQ